MSRLIDVSIPLDAKTPVWPGQDTTVVERFRKIEEGSHANVSNLAMSAHSGTHIDAPYHSLEHGHTTEEWPLDLFVGPALVADAGNVSVLTPEVLDGLDIPPGTERVLIKTRNSGLWQTSPETFVKDFTAFDDAGAQWVVDKGIKVIGVDYLSIELFNNPVRHSTHKVLLNAGVLPLEGLDLSNAKPGAYELICLPLRLKHSDGAPARVLLRTLD